MVMGDLPSDTTLRLVATAIKPRANVEMTVWESTRFSATNARRKACFDASDQHPFHNLMRNCSGRDQRRRSNHLFSTHFGIVATRSQARLKAGLTAGVTGSSQYYVQTSAGFRLEPYRTDCHEQIALPGAQEAVRSKVL
jgi:hypothetical protein